jgi:type I restriction enzyme S subunit
VRLPCPSVAKQRAVADYLDFETSRVDAVIRARQRQAALLVERQRTVCRDLVTGGDQPYEIGPLRRWWSVIDCKHRTPTYVPDGIALVSTGEVRPGRLDLSRTNRYVSVQDYEDLASPPRRPRRGDLVYSRNASLGAAAYVDTDEPFCMGQDVCLITSKAEDQQFLSYALELVARDELNALAVGSTFKRINVDQIKALRVPHPEPADQRRIAAECSKVDGTAARIVDAIDRQITLLRERREALITLAVSGQLEVMTARAENTAA